MGEYAMYEGRQVKIGTCEQMYYLRADQARHVQPLPGNVDPMRDREALRFRFPFPDEDGRDPGSFHQDDGCRRGFDGALWVSDVQAPDGVEHHSIQFRHEGEAGTLLVSLPCPCSKVARDSALKVHRNGYSGDVGIHSQRVVGDLLVLVCKCGACGALWRCPTADDAMPIIEACRKRAADSESRAGLTGYPEASRAAFLREASFWLKVATRIAAGYAPGAGKLGARESE